METEAKRQIERRIFAAARESIQVDGTARPELQWLQKRFTYIQKKYGLKNGALTDRFLCERMLERELRTETECLKLCYINMWIEIIGGCIVLLFSKLCKYKEVWDKVKDNKE